MSAFASTNFLSIDAAAYLVAKCDDGFGDVHALQRGVTYGVGRSPKNRIVLPDDLCSRDHAELAYTEDAWYVRDLESLTGPKSVLGVLMEIWHDVPFDV